MDRTHSVLVTGAAGFIGQASVAALRANGHRVRGMDLKPPPDHDPLRDDFIVGDIADRQTVDRATAGIDTVFHLAAQPNNADFMEKLLRPNVIGLYHVVNSARQAGVRRIILASTVQVSSDSAGHHDPAHRVTHRYPSNDYALTKLWAEDLGEMTARCHGIEVIAARFVWVPHRLGDMEKIGRKPEYRAIYLSPRDAGRFAVAAVEATLPDTAPKFHVVYATGPGFEGHQPCDPEPARQLLGFTAHDVFPEGMTFEAQV